MVPLAFIWLADESLPTFYMKVSVSSLPPRPIEARPIVVPDSIVILPI